MKGDFTRDTFKPEEHYRQVLMQQGRVQLDADWNEQAAIAARRDETTMADLVGDCGGPADGAAFGAITSLADLTKVPSSVANWFNALSAGEKTSITTALANGDFLLSPGRYYVDGIQCELEQPVLFSQQADLPGATAVANGASLLYLDVWQRHLTALEMPALLDAALGGVDTATRAKTVWQVRSLALSGGVPSGACAADIPEYNSKTALSRLRLKAQTQEKPKQDDPCQVPETVGYSGLENQLYRVEIHEVNNDGTAKNWKWSRENGSVVSRLLKIDKAKKQLTVESLGRDDVLGFVPDQWVEILDDALELEGNPGQLIQIAEVNPANLTITLKAAPDPLTSDVAFPDGVNPARHPKIRRWDGQAKMDADLLLMEAGIQVSFDGTKARSHTGDYWQIPARAATASAQAGDIEWPRELKPGTNEPDPTKPLSLLPRGITHHYCRLGFIVMNPPAGTDKFTDCRCLWAPLTAPTLEYVSGDGQETMPDLTTPAVKPRLPQPLVVGAFNGQCSDGAIQLRCKCKVGAGQLSSGQLDVAGPASPPGGATDEVVLPAPNGLVVIHWWLENNASVPVQQVEVTLFDDAKASQPLVTPPLRFNANLSLANQVAFDPRGACPELSTTKTVQDAIKLLCELRDREPGIVVRELRLRPNILLLNDSDVLLDDFLNGIDVFCDGTTGGIDPVSASRATVFVTLETPLALNSPNSPLFGGQEFGFQPVILAGVVQGEEKIIRWTPSERAKKWLDSRIPDLIPNVEGKRLLVRLTLKGNFIWDVKNPDLFLDGEVFGRKRGTDRTDLRLEAGESGDGRRGGDFEMWFWLVAEKTNTPPTISAISNQTIVVGGTVTVSFQVGDVETPAGNLIVSASSSNTALVPNRNLILSGTGANRTLLVTPAAGQSGTTIITLTVVDEAGASASTSFSVTVNSIIRNALLIGTPKDHKLIRRPVQLRNTSGMTFRDNVAQGTDLANFVTNLFPTNGVPVIGVTFSTTKDSPDAGASIRLKAVIDALATAQPPRIPQDQQVVQALSPEDRSELEAFVAFGGQFGIDYSPASWDEVIYFELQPPG
ncbi:MAG: hypothetical protein HYY24_08570 [Verrucomicrobia bacterium]|nr:hypothetical protein [Verrucomicrobiota bacterium]